MFFKPGLPPGPSLIIIMRGEKSFEVFPDFRPGHGPPASKVVKTVFTVLRVVSNDFSSSFQGNDNPDYLRSCGVSEVRMTSRMVIYIAGMTD